MFLTSREGVGGGYTRPAEREPTKNLLSPVSVSSMQCAKDEHLREATVRSHAWRLTVRRVGQARIRRSFQSGRAGGSCGGFADRLSVLSAGSQRRRRDRD